MYKTSKNKNNFKKILKKYYKNKQLYKIIKIVY